MRTPREALSNLKWLEKSGPRFPIGQCKKRTRLDSYNVPSDGSTDATEAWHNTRHRFQHRWIPGAFIWWTGGSEGHGHVAVMGWRRGYIRTVDFPREGHWNTTTVAALEKAWPRIVRAGCSLDIDGVVVRPFPRFVLRWFG